MGTRTTPKPTAGGQHVEARSRAIQFLTPLPCFRTVEASAIEQIVSDCRRISAWAEESIFIEGEVCTHLYILVAGRVKCYRANPEGREQILAIFERPGDAFCTASAFSTGSHIVTAAAITNATLYAIDVEAIKRLALEQPPVALALVTAAGDQMQALVGLADDLSLKTATERVAKLLYERARAKGEREGQVRLGRDDPERLVGRRLHWAVWYRGSERARADCADSNAYSHTLTAAANAGVWDAVRTRIRALFGDPAARSGFVARVIGKEVGLD